MKGFTKINQENVLCPLVMTLTRVGFFFMLTVFVFHLGSFPVY